MATRPRGRPRDVERFIANVPEEGSISGTKLRTHLGWDNEKFDREANAFIQKGYVVRGGGRDSGSYRRAPIPARGAPSVPQPQRQDLVGREVELYEPFVDGWVRLATDASL